MFLLPYAFVVQWTQRKKVCIRLFQDVDTANLFRRELNVLCAQLVHDTVNIDGDLLVVEFEEGDYVSIVQRHDIY